MKIVFKQSELDEVLNLYRKQSKSIAFVPTLGALHDGHMSLIKIGHKKSDIVVCSIFLNPTQFNEQKDLDNYPKTFEADRKKLEEVNCDILFYPDQAEIYPSGLDKKSDIELGHIDKVLEGAFRPGHFEGVVQVVKRLLEIVNPDILIMGQKDFQQFSIIKFMIKYYKLDTVLEVAPIIREKNGLAMSSRNTRLSKDGRAKAGIINRILMETGRDLKKYGIEDVKLQAKKKMMQAGYEVEYLEVIEGNTLLDVVRYHETKYVVGLVAVWVEGVRLIDNIIFKN